MFADTARDRWVKAKGDVTCGWLNISYMELASFRTDEMQEVYLPMTDGLKHVFLNLDDVHENGWSLEQ